MQQEKMSKMKKSEVKMSNTNFEQKVTILKYYSTQYEL